MRKAKYWLCGSILLLGYFHTLLDGLNKIAIDLVRLCGNVEKLLSALETIARHF